MPEDKRNASKLIKRVVIGLAIYPIVVIGFESMLGHFQPQHSRTMVIATFDEDGTKHERVVTRMKSDDRLYVAANHWPRAWYRRAVDNPEVEVTIDGEKDGYRAVEVDGAEFDRVDGEYPRSLGFRMLTGFPPRRILRLDPRP